MNNFAEDISYWYFRLNGFFPIMNHILHKFEKEDCHGETDILAIRLPGTYEAVGGVESDYDDLLRQYLDPNKSCGAIVEVKSGDDSSEKIREDKVRGQLCRLGIASKSIVDELMPDFMEGFCVTRGDFCMSKILIARHQPRDRSLPYIGLDHCIKFIVERFRRYENSKCCDRMFFPSEIIQFIAYLTKNNGMNVLIR